MFVGIGLPFGENGHKKGRKLNEGCSSVIFG